MASKDEFMTAFQPLVESREGPLMSSCEVTAHLLKAALGTGVLAMPIGFKHAGLIFGIFGSVLATTVCAHSAYLLVKCAHELYVRTKVNALTFQEVAETACATGPDWSKKISVIARNTILIGLFTTYFGTCSVYTVIVANNIQQVVEYYSNSTVDERWFIAGLLPPLILLSLIPNLKWLVPVSMTANVFMAMGLAITIYYLVQDLPSIGDRKYFGHPHGWPQFFSIVIFAVQAIGVVMPLENGMKNPRNFISMFGVLNQAMSLLCFLYTTIGFLGYLKYGDETRGSVTLNLPVEEFAAQAVKVLIALGVFCTYGLQYVVPVQMLLNAMNEKFPDSPNLVTYTVRPLLTTATVALAVAVPTIGPFISLIGALCMSIIGIVVPAFLEVITYWDSGLGFWMWRLWKDVFMCIFGLMALVFGTYTSMEEIVAIYTSDEVTND